MDSADKQLTPNMNSDELAVADPLPLQSPFAEIKTGQGRTRKFSPLTLNDRAEINAELRRLVPHPLLEASEFLCADSPFRDGERKLIVEHALAKLDLMGWPVTLDSPFGRRAALADGDTMALMAFLSLKHRDPVADPAEARAILRALDDKASKRVIEILFELRPGTLDEDDEEGKEGDESDGGPADPKDSSLPTNSPTLS